MNNVSSPTDADEIRGRLLIDLREMINASSPNDADAPASRRFRFQLSILTLLILASVVAAWTAYWIALQETRTIQAQLPGLRQVARELIVEAPDQYAAVHRVPEWMSENIWDIHIPQDRQYQIMLATEQVEKKQWEKERVSQPTSTATISPGVHSVEVKRAYHEGQSIITVLIDGQSVIEETKPRSWDQRLGSSGGSQIGQTVQRSTDEPLILFRRRFFIKTATGTSYTPDGPGSGILLWIDRP